MRREGMSTERRLERTISTHAGRGVKLEHRRNDPPLGDEKSY